MNNEDMKSIFDQINNLKKPVTESKETNAAYEKDAFREVLNGGGFMSDNKYVTIQY